MAHYSSQLSCQEDGAKNPLKSIPVKRLVFASYAQFGVNAELIRAMGACNGIQCTTHVP